MEGGQKDALPDDLSNPESRESGPSPMEIVGVEESEEFAGLAVVATKVRPWWIDAARDHGYELGSIYPCGKHIKAHLREVGR